jgi:transposase InsO family protein
LVFGSGAGGRAWFSPRAPAERRPGDDPGAKDHSSQDRTAGVGPPARQRQPSLQDDGLLARQLLSVQGALRQRRRGRPPGDQPPGRIYQQTFIDTYAKVAFAKLYDRKTPITAADLLNDRVLPFFDEHDIRLSRVLTDRGTEYCGNPERHEFELYLAVEDIDHTRTKTKSPQTNGICERFHRTVLDEFYRVAFRKKLYRTIEELQADLDVWVAGYNHQRPHQGRWCYGKTPTQTLIDALPLAKEKLMAA